MGPGPGSAKSQNRWGSHPRVGSSQRCSKLYCDIMLLPIAFIILRYSKLYRDTTHYDILIIFVAFLCLLFLFPPEPVKHKFAKYFIFPIQNQSNISQDC